MNEFKDLANSKGQAYDSDKTVQKHDKGCSIDGKGSMSVANARVHLINAAKNNK
ncbi:hypothetical protein [Owenweeksia hongkongensis]|uniref:hypothetical protein n=1 Tax=Owenweeksia hongkongensis TaxID=253245 RepID=UPI003A8DC05E